MRILKVFIIILIVFSIFTNFSFADDLDIDGNVEYTFNENIESTPMASTDSDLHILSRRAVVFERNSKVFLYKKNADEKCAMASTTKIMTCLIVLENCNLEDSVVVSKKAARNWWITTWS